MKRMFGIFLLLIYLLGISTTAFAAEMGDKDKNISLRIVYQDDGQAIAGATVQLYKVASIDQNLKITADRSFSRFRRAIEDSDTDWSQLSKSLVKVILENNVSCYDQTKTDRSGVAHFPARSKELTPGVYLVYCPKHIVNGTVYYASPMIVSLPNYGADGQLTNQVTAKIKNAYPFTLVVEKKWKDRGHEAKRPDKITVQLLKDGNPVANATKDIYKKHQWTTVWKDLDPLYDWDVQEVAVKGYKGRNYPTREKGNVIKITITNTYAPESHNPPGNSGKPSNKLPQTGQLTWPIPVMAVTGMTLFALGWWLCFGSRKDP